MYACLSVCLSACLPGMRFVLDHVLEGREVCVALEVVVRRTNVIGHVQGTPVAQNPERENNYIRLGLKL
jgi:hypothetical protein